MVFTISDMIAFRSDDGVMWNLAEPERRLSFTAIPARIFTYLLENNDKVIEREELFNSVWKKYGLEPSSNSLHAYISLFRKSLIELGCEENIIKTVPRVGFYIPGEMVSSSDRTHQAPFVENSINPAVRNQKVSIKTWGKLLLLAFCIIIFTLTIQPFSSTIERLDYNFDKSALYKIGTIADCPVYSLSESSPYATERKLQLALEISTEHLPCTRDGIFIFQSGEHYTSNQFGRAFLARCTNNEENLSRISDCKAVYVYAK